MEYSINTFLSGAVCVTSDCIRHKSKRAACRQCIDYCEHCALVLVEDGSVEVNTEACTRCGGCVFACPVMAINGPLPERHVNNMCLYQDSGSVPSQKELLLYYQAGYHTLILHEKHSLWINAIDEVNLFLHTINKSPFSIIPPSLDNNDSYFESDGEDIKRRRLLGVGFIRQYFKKTSCLKICLWRKFFHHGSDSA